MQFSHTENVTWDYLPIGIWSAVETHVGVMVASLPAIRSLQRSVRERLFPKPPASTSHYEDSSRNTNKIHSRKSSRYHKWLSKTDRSQLSTLGRSQIAKEDFVRLDDYEISAGLDIKKGPIENRFEERFAERNHSAKFLNLSFPSSEDFMSQISASNPTEWPLSGIRVQKEYSIDREGPDLR